MRSLMMMFPVVMSLSCGSSGPDQGPALDGSKYARTCTQASDCLAVTLHPCGCTCLELAINQQSKVQWQNDKNAISCAPVTCESNCIGQTVSCQSGQCTLSSP